MTPFDVISIKQQKILPFLPPRSILRSTLREPFS